jgi:hypothetical protein
MSIKYLPQNIVCGAYGYERCIDMVIPLIKRMWQWRILLSTLIFHTTGHNKKRGTA